MAKVEIYLTPICGYCSRAKRLLNNKGVTYTEYNVLMKPELRQEMTQRTGGHTVPQIIIDDRPIGGFDDMVDLDLDDKLDPLLGIG